MVLLPFGPFVLNFGCYRGAIVEFCCGLKPYLALSFGVPVADYQKKKHELG
jgi:hypothetical protein